MPSQNLFGRRRGLMSNPRGPLIDPGTIALLMAAMPQPYGTNQWQLGLQGLQQSQEAEQFRQREQRLMESEEADRAYREEQLTLQKAAGEREAGRYKTEQGKEAALAQMMAAGPLTATSRAQSGDAPSFMRGPSPFRQATEQYPALRALEPAL